MALTVSVLQGGTNSHATTSEEINFQNTDFISQGVIGAITNTSGVAPATGAFAANAQGTPDMTIAVTAGVAYVTATPTSGNSQTLRVTSSATENVTISANATGGTRYDWVYIKIDPDKAKDPNAGASDVATLVTSRSTSATTDNGTPPTYGYNIAVVTVANGASSITNGNIADKRKLASTAVVGQAEQVVSTNYSDVATGTTLIPSDNTIPQITEGDEYMSVTITPKSSTNILVIEAVLHGSHSVSSSNGVALFQDSTANALAANSVFQGTGTGRLTLVLKHRMAAGTTASTTFKIRAGGSSAGTFTLNGSSGGRIYGGVTGSNITVTEYKA